MAIKNLNVLLRKEVIAGPKEMRKEGLIPGVIYGRGIEPLNVVFKETDMERLLRSPHALVRLKIGGEQERTVVIKQVQRGPVGRELLHVGFEAVAKERPVSVHVPIKLIYSQNSPWREKKAVLRQRLDVLHVEAFPEDIVEEIKVNVTDLSPGKILHVSDLELPKLKPLDHPQTEVASLSSAA